ncbi:MAG: hypothetical protein P8Y94_15220 [Acidobacteriota bacterium]
MNRRELLKTTLGAAAAAPAAAASPWRNAFAGCACELEAAPAAAPPASAPRLKVTDLKVIGVTSDVLMPDRPHIFVKLETDAGVIGWGEATLEGKAGAAMQAVKDLSYAIIGQDPMRVEHLWQSMYVHGFYRAGPVLGSAISGIDMALWDIRGKVLGKPVYELLGGPLDDRGVRGYYHLMSGGTRSLLPPDAPYRDQVAEVRRRAEQYGVTAFKTGIPGRSNRST